MLQPSQTPTSPSSQPSVSDVNSPDPTLRVSQPPQSPLLPPLTTNESLRTTSQYDLSTSLLTPVAPADSQITGSSSPPSSVADAVLLQTILPVLREHTDKLDSILESVAICLEKLEKMRVETLEEDINHPKSSLFRLINNKALKIWAKLHFWTGWLQYGPANGFITAAQALSVLIMPHFYFRYHMWRISTWIFSYGWQSTY